MAKETQVVRPFTLDEIEDVIAHTVSVSESRVWIATVSDGTPGDLMILGVFESRSKAEKTWPGCDYQERVIQ